MLCDFAEVSGGKLFISGAGVNLVGTAASEAPHPVNISLAIMVRIPWTATNHQHRLTIELVEETDTGRLRIPINEILPPGADEADKGMIFALFNAGRSPTMVVGELTLMPVALPMFGLPLPSLGSYSFSISLDGTEVDKVSFRVATVMNLQGAMPPGGPPMM